MQVVQYPKYHYPPLVIIYQSYQYHSVLNKICYGGPKSTFFENLVYVLRNLAGTLKVLSADSDISFHLLDKWLVDLSTYIRVPKKCFVTTYFCQS